MINEQKKIFIARNGFITKEGWQFLFLTARDIFAYKKEIEAVRKIMPIEVEKRDLPLLWPYRESSRCKACGHSHLFEAPLSTWNSSLNVLDRTCVRCGYMWSEQCQDGSKYLGDWIWMGE